MTYDKIGNRLTFAKQGDQTASYCYTGGTCAAAHNPKLQTVTPASGVGHRLVECENCDEPDWLGHTDSSILQWLFIRDGLMQPIRTMTLCKNNATLWNQDQAANTVIHEWAHGCGYFDDPCPAEGIPCGEE